MELRHYQASAIDQIKAHYRQGTKRVLLHLATGGGKTLCFCTVIKQAVAKGSSVLVVVRGIKLVHQASDRLTREGVPHGIIQGNNSYNEHLPVIVASVDSLFSRREKIELPDPDLIIIDECHLSFGKKYEWFLEHYDDQFYLPVSATPHDRRRGMRHIADAVVFPIGVEQLIEEGYLCRMRYYEPSKIDRSRLETSSGDFTEKSMTEVMTESIIMGDIVDNWIKKGGNRPTFLFCSSIKHSKKMCERFEEAGITIEHMDANTPLAKRDEILARLVSRKTQIVSGVGVHTTGVDVPELGCLILARPTKSYNVHIQIMGRGTRPATEDCFVFDHVGNLREHGPLEDEKECNLDPVPKSMSVRSEPRMVTCDFCFASYPWKGNGKVCPECQKENDNKDTKKQEDLDYEMREYRPPDPWIVDLKKWIDIAKRKQYKRGWIFYKVKTQYGDEIAGQLWPKIRAVRGLPKSEKTQLMSV
jgi:superfamily II DNA or RNA helicase